MRRPPTRPGRALCAGLALVLLAVASAPCPGSPSAGRAPDVAQRSAPDGHGAAAGEEAAPALVPPCPCGCDHGPATASAASRLPAALLLVPPDRPVAGEALRAAGSPALRLAARSAAIDHVPIPSSRLHATRS